MNNETNRNVYLDNSATTRPYDFVIDLMVKIMAADYGNPSSLHRMGLAAEEYVKTARGQVAQFRLETDKTPDEIRDYLNEYLPDDIGVTSVAVAAPRFHSRFNASQKTYLYRICKDKSYHVFDRKYLYEYRGSLDTAAMKVATIQLRGEHDFRSFCGNPRMRKSTVRKLYAIHIIETPDEIDLEFIGEGFLQYMVRILVGTLIEVGEGKRDPFSMKELLEAKDRNLAGPTAPARGLTLMEVKYN